MTSDPPAPLLRYHGGKWKIAPWVIQHFPPHAVYVEPFGGAAGVLLRKPISRAEVYNDLDSEIVNLFRVVRDPNMAKDLARRCALTPYAREELDCSNEPADTAIEQARRTLFRAWASFGSAGATRGYSGFRTFTKPNKTYTPVAHSWARVASYISQITERFRRVVIENRPAIDVMKQHDSQETLHYVDPPYLPETRTFDGGRYYRHEMDADQHSELLETLNELRGMVVLSGYASDLYSENLKGWSRSDLSTSGSSRFGSVKRTECLWLSPNTWRRIRQNDLFDGAHI